MKCHYVEGYTRENGEKVKGYVRCRRGNPNSSKLLQDAEKTVEELKKEGLLTADWTAEQILDAGGYYGDYDDILELRIWSNTPNFIRMEYVTDEYRAKRYFDLEEGYIKNEVLEVNKDKRGGGIGTKVLRRQVNSATKMGFTKIKTLAARTLNGEPANGYTFWPKVGYYETDNKFTVWNSYNPDKFKKAKTLWELYEIPQGYELWQAQGEGIHVEFDLKKGSESRKRLAKYVVNKRKNRNFALVQRLKQILYDYTRRNRQKAGIFNDNFRHIQRCR